MVAQVELEWLVELDEWSIPASGWSPLLWGKDYPWSLPLSFDVATKGNEGDCLDRKDCS